MQAKDKVVRLLILYNAVGLVVPFKNSNNEPSQTEVDNLLRQANPAVSYEATGKAKVRKAKTGKIKRASKPIYETLYTKLRNDFVHAEERGSDPTAAIKSIEQNIAAFQRVWRRCWHNGISLWQIQQSHQSRVKRPAQS